jgi:hypothetical protein
MFSIVNAFCIRGLPIGDVDRVVFISTRDTSGRAAGLSFAEFEDVRDSMHSAMNLSAYVVAPAALSDEGRPADRVFAAYVSATTFSAIGATPIRGRDFRASDDALERNPS